MTRFGLPIAVALFLAIAAGCDTTGTTSNWPQNDPGPTQLSAPAAGPVGLAGEGGASQYDQRFVRHALQDSMGVATMSRMAAQKSTNPQVQDFAKRMVKTHADFNDRLRKLADDKGVETFKDLSADDQRDVMQLKKYSGKEFDHLYVEAMIRAFSSIANAMHDVAKHSPDGDIRSFADGREPQMREHNQAAKQLSQSLDAAK